MSLWQHLNVRTRSDSKATPFKAKHNLFFYLKVQTKEVSCMHITLRKPNLFYPQLWMGSLIPQGCQEEFPPLTECFFYLCKDNSSPSDSPRSFKMSPFFPLGLWGFRSLVSSQSILEGELYSSLDRANHFYLNSFEALYLRQTHLWHHSTFPSCFFNKLFSTASFDSTLCIFETSLKLGRRQSTEVPYRLTESELHQLLWARALCIRCYQVKWALS